MNYFTSILLFLIVGCSSSKDKKYQDLESKLDKLTKLMEAQQNNKNKDTSKEETKKEEVITEEKTFPISLPVVTEQSLQQNKKKIILGQKNGQTFEFIFNKNSYWVKIKPQIENNSELELRIQSAELENPETISLVQVDADTFQGSGDSRVGLTNIELHYRVKTKETIIINFDLNFKD